MRCACLIILVGRSSLMTKTFPVLSNIFMRYVFAVYNSSDTQTITRVISPTTSFHVSIVSKSFMVFNFSISLLRALSQGMHAWVHQVLRVHDTVNCMTL